MNCLSGSRMSWTCQEERDSVYRPRACAVVEASQHLIHDCGIQWEWLPVWSLIETSLVKALWSAWSFEHVHCDRVNAQESRQSLYWCWLFTLHCLKMERGIKILDGNSLSRPKVFCVFCPFREINVTIWFRDFLTCFRFSKSLKL